MRFILFLLLAVSQTFVFGQDFSSTVDSLYNFKPANLTYKEQEQKGILLDQFWTQVKNDTTQLLPKLRHALLTNKHNPYFYYDGSSLLLMLSKNKSDKELAVEAISKCDLNDISQKIYVQNLNRLANQGIDVTKPALKILADEKFSFFIPEHAMKFNQGYCLTYMLVPLENQVYIDTLISIFRGHNLVAQKSIITTLWFTSDCKSDAFIKSIATDTTVPIEVRTYATKMMSYTELSKDQKSYLKLIGKSHVNELRKNALTRFSDEAIEELDMTTRIIRKNNKCQ